MVTYSKTGTLVDSGVARDGTLLGEVALGRPCSEVGFRHFCAVQDMLFQNRAEGVFVVKMPIM